MSRTLVLIDGEHYPDVTADAVRSACERGHEVVAALLVGGVEKLKPGEVPEVGVEVRLAGGDLESALAAALEELRPEVVLDLSDEPVLGYRERMVVASIVLTRGVRYEGSDFSLMPPPLEPVPGGIPSVAVIGTGKRTGKTAISGQLTRLASARGLSPVVVAMGRGGPAAPEVAEAGTVTLKTLVGLARQGRHAASDYLEDAVTTGATTIGARRAGGGLAGAPYLSNVTEAVGLAAARRPGLIVLEGSGAAVPPLAWNAGILVIPVTCPVEYLAGYLGPYRLLRTDLAVVTMAVSPSAGPENLSRLTTHLRDALGDARFVVTDFHPAPLGEVSGRKAFFVTTASDAVAAGQARRLETSFGCQVVGWSSRLADRTGLKEDLDSAPGYDVLLTELKAAAIDVASEMALARGAEVVFVDNRAEVVAGERGATDLDAALSGVIDLARERGNA